MGKNIFTPKNLVLFAFVAVEAAIYAAFNVISAASPSDPIYLKYSGILLCLAVSVAMVFLSGAERDAVILACGLAFTSVSDLLILVLDDYYEWGLVTFIITQSLYFYRLYLGRVNKIWISLAVRVVLSAALIGVFGGLSLLNLLVAEVSVYIVMLVCNLADAVLLCGRGYKNIMFAAGLLLFLCCDICVGLHNGDVIGLELPNKLLAFVQFAIWAFYLPSQVLITCSVKRGGLPAKPVREKGKSVEAEDQKSD